MEQWLDRDRHAMESARRWICSHALHAQWQRRYSASSEADVSDRNLNFRVLTPCAEKRAAQRSALATWALHTLTRIRHRAEQAARSERRHARSDTLRRSWRRWATRASVGSTARRGMQCHQARSVALALARWRAWLDRGWALAHAARTGRLVRLARGWWAWQHARRLRAFCANRWRAVDESIQRRDVARALASWRGAAPRSHEAAFDAWVAREHEALRESRVAHREVRRELATTLAASHGFAKLSGRASHAASYSSVRGSAPQPAHGALDGAHTPRSDDGRLEGRRHDLSDREMVLAYMGRMRKTPPSRLKLAGPRGRVRWEDEA